MLGDAFVVKLLVFTSIPRVQSPVWSENTHINIISVHDLISHTCNGI